MLHIRIDQKEITIRHYSKAKHGSSFISVNNDSTLEPKKMYLLTFTEMQKRHTFDSAHVFTQVCII